MEIDLSISDCDAVIPIVNQARANLIFDNYESLALSSTLDFRGTIILLLFLSLAHRIIDVID
jgi:hypothetical protein